MMGLVLVCMVIRLVRMGYDKYGRGGFGMKVKEFGKGWMLCMRVRWMSYVVS